MYSTTWPNHLQHLESVLSTLKQHQLYTKLSKCNFGQEQIEYLRHIVSVRGVEMDQSKVAAIIQWPPPNSLKQLRAFLGLSGYDRRFIKQYASLAKPLTNLLKKDSFLWTESSQASFDTLNHAITTAPVLILPNFSQPFVLEPDASGVAIGAVLSQHNHPIAYFSKKLSPRTQMQSAYVSELYALTDAISKFCHYLLGHLFIIRTDKQALRHLCQQTN